MDLCSCLVSRYIVLSGCFRELREELVLIKIFIFFSCLVILFARISFVFSFLLVPYHLSLLVSRSSSPIL